MGLFAGMTSLRSRLRRTGTTKIGAPGAEGVDEAVRIISTVMPKVRAVSHFERRLRDVVGDALRYADGIVQEPGAVASLQRSAWSEDPLVNALFTSAEQLQTVVNESPLVRKWFEDTGSQECCFLLMSSRREQTSFGTEKTGEIVHHGVRQKVVTFYDHKLLALSPSMEETRRELSKLAVRYLATRASENILFIQTTKSDLERAREALKGQMKVLRLQERGLELFENRQRMDAKIKEAEDALAEIDKNLEAVRARLGDVDDYMRELQDVLRSPETYLRAEKTTLRLDRYGVEREADEEEAGSEIGFVELVAKSGERRAAVYGKASRG